MLLLEDKKAAFIHIPKTAGKSIARLLGYEHHPSHHSVADAPKDFEQYFRFCFVRHPVNRFVSAINYHLQCLKAPWLTERHLDAHPIRRMLRDKFDGDLNTFIDRVVRDCDQKILFRSAHLRPQTFWIERTAPQFIGRHESLESDAARLCKMLDIAFVGTPKLNVSPKRVAVSDLSSASTKFLMNLYQKDMAALGY
jgi:hypothetical protein